MRLCAHDNPRNGAAAWFATATAVAALTLGATTSPEFAEARQVSPVSADGVAGGPDGPVSASTLTAIDGPAGSAPIDSAAVLAAGLTDSCTGAELTGTYADFQPAQRLSVASAPAPTSTCATAGTSPSSRLPTSPVSAPAPGSSPQPVPSQPAPGTCGVSGLLVPSCGAWLGAATTDAARAYDYRVGLSEYEAVAQNAPDIMHFYRSGGNPFPTSTYRALAHRPGKQRALMLINWKPSTSLTWRQIADGAADGLIESASVGMRDYPHKFFLTIWHEPENDFGPGRQPEDYAAMYRHVVTKLRSLGVTNTVFVWNMMGYSGHSALYDRLYPGHDVVDWIAWDPYSSNKSLDDLVNENCCRVPNWTGFYDWATRKAPGKPLMLAEWGFNLLTHTNGPGALQGGPALLQSKYPQLKALVYWNENRTAHFRIDTTAAFAAAYRAFANDSYFNLTSPDVAP